MSGSTAAPFYNLPYSPAMSSHLVDSNYSSGDNNTYLASSMGAGPSTQPNGNLNGENTPGSTKRPFPWASSESDRDKRPRSGNGSGSGPATATDDAEETMSTDESTYASAAESPNPHFSRSPTRVDWPLSVVDESEAPRIPTPAALRSSSPLQLPNLLSQSGFRPVSPPTTITTSNPPLRLALSSRPPSSSTNNIATEQSRTQPLDLGWLTRQLDEAIPPPRDRAFSLSFGSASVDSALPHSQHSRAASTRVPLPWVDIEGDSGLLGPGSESLSTSLEPDSAPDSTLGLEDNASSPGVASTIRSEHSPPTTTHHSPPTRRPLSLNLRNFPLVPGPDSPAFPTSASPRTSAFDLAVTPPGSALPSFVARMMEVDSPVHGGGDSYVSSQAETYIPSTESYIPSPSRQESYISTASETYIPSASQSEPYVPSQSQTGTYETSSIEAENDSASIDALRRFMRHEANADHVREEEGGAYVLREQGNRLAHQDGASGFAQGQSAGLLRQSHLESSSPSPDQAPAGVAVAVGSYFPASEPHERQAVARRVPLAMGSSFEAPPRHGHEPSRNGHEPVSRNPRIEQVSTNDHDLEPPLPRASHTERMHPSEDSATNTMGSIYSRRLTESGISFPSRPSDSGSSLPSFRATVSPEPGRMSWSDLFGARTPETPSTRESEVATSARGSEITMSTRSDATMSMRASEISLGTRTSDATMGTRTTEARMSEIETSTSASRAGVRSALNRAVRLAEGPPRLHLDALPREDQSSATNLSRTPPAPDSHPAVWFEDSAHAHRTSSTRWTDLFPEPAAAPVPIVSRPAHRARMPPPVSISSTDSTVFDPLTGMSWNRNSHAVSDPPSSTYDASESLARYQTFAQSIDEIRRSPPPPQQSAPPETTSWGGTGVHRSSWAFPRHEPPQYEPPLPPLPPPTDGNWLREWESQRDRRSREAREDYVRGRDTDYGRRHDSEYGGSDEAVSRPPPVAQLNDTQAVWPDIMGRPRPRPRPMTRASLVATGFADSDLWPEGEGSNNRLWGEIPSRPSRRAELLPARVDDVDTPMQFLPNNHEGEIFTESPPSLLEDFNDSGPYPESISVSGIAPPSRPDPVNFRSASRVLRASLVDTSRRASDGPSRPVPSQVERPRVHSRDRWESQLSRSQVQLERVRQLLHRSNDREASRRHPPDPPTQPHRRSFLPGLDNEIPSSTISSDSRRSSMSGVAWPRPAATDVPPPRPFSLHEGERPEWSSPDVSSRTAPLPHELIRASSLRGRRRRTLLPESASRRDSTGFLHSMNSALNQVESGLLHLNRELDALADEGSGHMRHYEPQNQPELVRPHTPPPRSGPRMDWAFEPAQRNPTPPPTLPPFEFASAQRNPSWPAERYSHLSGETSGLGLDLPGGYPTHRAPTRGPEGYFDQRQSVRDLSTRGTRASYAHEGSWRSSAPSNEWWSNDASSPSLPTHMPLRDRLLFRPSGSSSHQPGATSRQPEPVNSRSNSMGSSMQAQPPSATFGRLHRRRLSPPAPPHQPSVSSSLLRPFANQNSSTSSTRSYASRFSHFLPRRNSGRGGGGSSDDNDEWHHAEQATRRFFLRPRGRARPTSPNGDYLRDDEFDDSYEGLLRLAARIGDAKPRGTPSEVIRSMVSCRYADSPGARAEARCPICLDDYSPDDIVTVVKRCSHWFHKECVQQWLSNSRTCPVCRGQADGEDPEPQAGPSTGASDHSWV